MEDSPRTFNNLPINCNLTCTTKDQVISTPKKKHSMILNLGNKNTNAFGVDQTPTPTRFIRNCEEVGLFQDLQNVNPFEETFRKAVESGKTGNLTLQNSRVSVVTDDTLHTPHVFPHIIEHESSTSDEPRIVKELASSNHDVQNRIWVASRLQGGVEEGCLTRSAVNVVRQEADTSQLRHIAPNIKPSGPVQLILQMPDGQLMQVNATQLRPDTGPVAINLATRGDKVNSVIFHTTVDKKPDSDNISPLIKQKLKARLGYVNHSNQQLENIDIKEKITGIATEQKLKSRNKRISSNASNSDDDEDTKRRKFLERNRAAAMRCREKRKSWVENLERRADQMSFANQQLQLEVGALRAEVAQLKTLLLAHKDCPVTRAMCNDQITESTIVLPVEPLAPLIKPPEIHVTTVQINPPLSLEETALRKNLQKKMCTVSTTSTPASGEIPVKVGLPKKKRLSLDIETAKQSHCLSDKHSPIVRSDKYLSSTLLPANSVELETLRDMGKPVATQVIQVNPNVLYRENRLTSPSIETPLLPISPQSTCIDYS